MDKMRHLEKTVMRTQVRKWVINIRQVVKVEFMHDFQNGNDDGRPYSHCSSRNILTGGQNPLHIV